MSIVKHRTIIEPFKIKVVEPLYFHTPQEREEILKKYNYNLFLVPSDAVTFDFLTDSGTAAMSAQQWASMITADETYAGSRSFARFEKVVHEITGYPHVIPTHQGRAAERILFSFLVKPGSKVPSNCHFDTTRANIEYLGGEAIDLIGDEGKDPALEHPFKGNMNIDRLDQYCKENQAKIPVGMITITNNTGGGQPVSLENLKKVSEVYQKYQIPFIIDACRFAENSYFIKMREPSQKERTIRDIVQDVFSLADGCLMSGKKDALSNIGGFIAVRESNWLPELKNNLILTEGFPTYGGLAARDLDAMAIGLQEVLDENYLAYRLATTRFMADKLNLIGIPTVRPAGAHAVYIDARAFLPHIPPEQFPGQSLVVELFRSEGVRSCEIGSAMFGKRREGQFVPALMELVRLAFPRRAYTQSHFEYILEGMADLVARKRELKGYQMVYEPPFLRHFTAHFAPI